MNFLKSKTKYIKYPLLGGFIFTAYVVIYLIIESLLKHTFSVVDVVKIIPAIMGICVIINYVFSYIFLSPFIIQYNNFAITEVRARSYVLLLSLFIGLSVAVVNVSLTHEIIKSIILFLSVVTVLVINFSYYIVLDKKLNNNLKLDEIKVN